MAEQHTQTSGGLTPSGIRATLDEWLGQSAPATTSTDIGTSVAAAICTGYQTFLVASVFLPGIPADAPVAAITGTWYGDATLVVTLIGAALLLLWSPRRPLTVLLIQCGLYTAASLMELNNSLLFPLLFALYACVSRTGLRRLATGLAAIWAAMTASSLLVSPAGGFAAEYAGQLVTALAVIAVAVAVRSVRGWFFARLRTDQETQRSQRLSQERDRALDRSRIAAELHDSVGHGLTTIIALTEGLAGTTGDPQIDEALAGINEVARESLADTRQAVRALADTIPGAGEQIEPSLIAVPDLHGWAEIAEVLAHVRSLGVTAALTETGRRPSDPVQADLCFALTREAITNAVRHTSRLTTIVVSWDHHRDGSVTATIRNDGHPADASDSGTQDAGSGLARLRRRTERAGGTLIFGPDPDQGWVLTASLPALARHQEPR